MVDKILDIRHKVQALIFDKKQDKATELIVEFIEKHNRIYTTKNDLKIEVWFYEEGIYKPNGMSKIKEITRDILDFMYTPQRVNSVIAKIQADTFIEDDVFFKMNYLEEVPVLNGILNLKTLELQPFTPEKIFFNKLPVKYNDTKGCSNIDKFLGDILTYPEDKMLAYEWTGYCLWKENILEQAVMMTGRGSNGKGTFERLIKSLLGEENVCSIPLSRLKPEDFSVSELFGKLANIVGDIGDEENRELKITETLRSIIARDPISAKRKWLRDLHFTNYSKQMFACNNLPIVRDSSIGFWRRWILLEFPYSFLSQEEISKKSDEEKKFCKVKDKDILKKMATPDELSGFLNEAIKGLHRIQKNGKFSYTKGSEEVKDLWIRKSDSFMAFCIDNIEVDVDSVITKAEVKRRFSKYCRDNKIKGTSDKAISITLDNMYSATTLFPASFGNTTLEYAWQGIKWKK